MSWRFYYREASSLSSVNSKFQMNRYFDIVSYRLASAGILYHSPRIPPFLPKPAISIPPSQCLYDIREKGHPESLFRKHCRRSTDAGLRLEEMGHI